MTPPDEKDQNVSSTSVRTIFHAGTGATAGQGKPSLAPSALEATRLQQQLSATIVNSSDYNMLRMRMADCYQRIQAPYAFAWYSRGADGNYHPSVHRLRGPVLERDEVQKDLMEAVAQCGVERVDIVCQIPAVKNLTSIHLPIGYSESATDVVSILLVNADTERINNEIMAGHHLGRAAVEWHRRQHSVQLSTQLRGTAALLELVGHVESGESLSESCSILANTLREYLNSNLVAVGLRKSSGLSCHVKAISSLGEFDKNSTKVRSIRAALDECAVRNEVSVWPPQNESEQYQLLASRKASDDLRMEFVVTVPLKSTDEKVCGAVLIAGSDSTLVDAEHVNFLQASGEPLGSSLMTMRRADGGRFRRFARRIFCREQISRWKLAGCAAIATGILLCVPMQYRIPCRCTVEPVERRFCVAPYDGMVETTIVQPGETVKAGQLLAKMDGREIQWELAGVTAEASRAMKERDTHMAQLQVPKSIMASLDVDRLTKRTELLKYRAANMEVRSPIDGIVLAGSIDRRENFPVKVGQTLYEISPLNEVRIEVAVPDEEASHVKTGMSVEVRVDSTTDVLTGIVERVRPRSEIRHDDNVFIAEVVLENPNQSLRPGAEGNARVITSRRTAGWVFFHRAWEKTVATLFW